MQSRIHEPEGTAVSTGKKDCCVQQKKTAGMPAGGRQGKLLHLQRTLGNRHVQRLVDLSCKADQESEVSPDVENAINQARGGGQRLDNSAQAQMSEAFNADFSGVRVHTGTQADSLNKSLNARAFTTGQDIFFGQGEYSPGSSSGRKLLAHELTHVVQQQSMMSSGGPLTVGPADDPYEREADRIADQVSAEPGKSGIVSPTIQQKTILDIQRENEEPTVGSVETSEGTSEIEGSTVTSSVSEIEMRLLTGESDINRQIDEWARENFNHVASSLQNAAGLFRTWHGLQASPSSSGFAFDVAAAGLGILAAAYPPAGVAAAILGGILSITKSAGSDQDQARQGEEGKAAMLISTVMRNKANDLRNSSGGFGTRLKARGESVWNNIGLALTMDAPTNMETVAKEELYRGAQMPSLAQDFTEPALTRMIHAYMNWERTTSLQDSIFFVSSEDIEWAALNDRQRRQRASQQARSHLNINEESLRNR